LKGFCGSCGSNRISEKKSVETISAADMHVVGWPLADAVVDRIESMRSWFAMFERAGSDVDMSGPKVYHLGAARRAIT
jgi:hypothetical protein